ncbi:MAG TPA: tetratricopeptide repeat protein, partial [Caulobacteraceae bacterium]|nr:tetratricopeptide repeat protein [Caulobacteraceae bacterium]
MTLSAGQAIAPEEQFTRLQLASRLLQEGRRAEAVAALRVLITMAPRLAEAHRLLGVGLGEMGDLAGAEAAYRTALTLDPAMARAATGLAEVLLTTERGLDALDVMARFVNDQTSNLSLLTYYGLALQAAGRGQEAVEVLTRATKVAPNSAVADHNLAGALVEVQDFVAGEAAARRARARGLDAAELWMNWARAVTGQGRLTEGEALYAEAVKRRPDFDKAVAELAHTVWMRSGDRAETMAVFDQVFARTGPTPELLMQKAALLDTMGDKAAAYDTLGAALAIKDDPAIHLPAAQLIVYWDPDRALRHAQRALEAQPGDPSHRAALCQVNLAMGRADEAAVIAESLWRGQPENQYAIALLATAWRIMGDERYRRLYDYDALVWRGMIDTPGGWPNLDSYLADLREALKPLHSFRGHLAGQSARHGSQTQQDLTRSTHPAIRAFFQAIDYPIRRRIASLGQGGDVLRRRITKAYDFNGVWSIKLQPVGFHVDHIHTRGWLSSACHIELPGAVEREPEGWLKFGQPGIPTSPALPPEYYVKPVLGQLVLFPSYMWHGTVPFSGDE